MVSLFSHDVLCDISLEMFKCSRCGGTIGGTLIEEATVDKKGRIVIPTHLRQGLGLREGAKVRLSLEDGKILVIRPVTPEEFIREMEGCIKEDSPVPKINPIEIKRIWEKP
jgi:AbrB family looped-hinge helix DNA binding protein